jgi:predicted acyltransferase
VEVRVPAAAESGAIRAPALKTWLFEHLYASWLPLRPASLLFALSVVMIWLAIVGGLHRRRWYLKL